MKYRRLLLVFCAPLVLMGQTAGLNGVVADEAGAVVPDAKIAIVNVDNGYRREVSTNGVGAYSAPALPVGRYRIEATKIGFGTSTRPEIKLDVQQVGRVDFILKPGQVVESVTVSAAAALLDSETTILGQVIDNSRIVELPLNGRNYLSLARMAAGTAPSVGGRTAEDGGFSASGQHGSQMNIMLDGLDNTSRISGGPLGWEAQVVRPSIDSVEEFRVVTSNLSAEFGYKMGGTVLVTTKSGTNALHGTAFEFFRNSALDGTNFFANRAGVRKPPFRQNQFGGTLGGPLRRDKTFLFGSYEGTRIRLGRSFVSTVPSLDVREGDFNRIRPVFDPATTLGTGAAMTRQPFPGNRIPRSRFDPLSSALIDLYPLPSTSAIVNNYFLSPSESNDWNAYDFKGDHNFSDVNRMFLRYSRRDKDRFQPGPLPLPADGGAGTITDIASHSLAASWTRVMGSSFTNDLRFGFSRVVSRFDIPGDEPLFQKFGIKGVPKTNVASSNDHGLTRFAPAGYAQLGNMCCWPNVNNLDLIHISDTAFKTIGRHSIKAGGEFRHENIYRNAARIARGQILFGREFSADPQNRAATGDALAEFQLGYSNSAGLGNENGENLNARTLSLFLQDDWKVTTRLTLNLGIRYDLFYAPTFPGGGVSTFLLDRSQTGPNVRLQQVRPKDSKDCVCDQDYNNFGPRVGLAYSPGKSTVIRAGFGVIFGQADSIYRQTARVQNQAPDFVEVTFNTPDRIQPALFLKDGFPFVQLPATAVPGPGLVGIFLNRRDAPTQYSQQWFLDVQKELPFNILTTLAYMGNGTRQLFGILNYNLPFSPGVAALASRRTYPFYNSVNEYLPLGNLSYNAFAWKLEKRFSGGLQILSAYTWSHAIDNVNEDINDITFTQSPLVPWNRALDRGSALTDVRHQYALSSIYELPLGKGRRWMNRGGLANAALGGWQVGGILSMNSGIPFTAATSGAITNAGGAERPMRLRDGRLSGSERSVDRWFDVSAFQVQPALTYGNAGRNILFGPGLRNLDFTLSKSFEISEGKRIQFRFESFNFTNTPAFGQPSPTINLPGAGAITSAGEPRRIQLGLKFIM